LTGVAPYREARVGLIVPSSNTNAEPLTAATLSRLPVIALASRFALPTDLTVAIDETVLGPPADLLAEADVRAIAFHGTSGSWMGLERDRALAAALQQRTGVPTTTASLATIDGLKALNIWRPGLVFPGPAAIANGIVAEYHQAGIELEVGKPLDRGLTNPEISLLNYTQIIRMISAAAVRGVDGLVCIGTNLRAGYLVEELEASLGLPIVDSALAVVWRLLEMTGVGQRPTSWGQLLATQ
jgi:maleate isomerase